MAEAAALALAAVVTERLHIHNINFLSDNQELVTFNSRDQSTPPGGSSISPRPSSTQQCKGTLVYSKIRSQNLKLLIH
jgi:hypothetical protein